MSTSHQPQSARRSLRERGKEQPVQENVIEFPNLKSVLKNFICRIDISSYEQLVCHIKQHENIEDLELLQLLSHTREVISLLDHVLHHFVEVLLAIKWYKRRGEVVHEYQGFLIDLLSAHNYYTELALEKLVGSFMDVGEDTSWDTGEPSTIEQQRYQNSHDAIQCILKIVPMSYTIFLKVIANLFPYFKKSAHQLEAYVYNMLKVIDYRPDVRVDLLLILFDRLICLDVNAPKSEIEVVEVDANATRMEIEASEMFTIEGVNETAIMSHPIANTLDLLLKRLFNYIHDVCYNDCIPATLNWQPTKNLYQDMLIVFYRLVLPTLDTHHVQFTMFYLCSFNVSLAESFLNCLWRKVLSPNEAPVVRQTAVLYIASLLARATYIPIIILKSMMSKIAEWIHNYISTQDGLENSSSDVRVHKVFFAVCQALFYVVAFRHRDLVNTRRNLTYLQSLNFTKMVTCRLNPLRVCIPPVVQNFAAVTRTYQLAYCYTIVEHNARNTMPVEHQDEHGAVTLLAHECLETFFPFDPYVLVRSSSFITPLYREYEKVSLADGAVLDALIPVKKDEDDDFLSDPLSSGNSTNNLDLFSYGTSPGFKHK